MTVRTETALPLPRFLQIEPVGQCNLRCRMCPIQFRTDGSPGGPPACARPQLARAAHLALHAAFVCFEASAAP